MADAADDVRPILVDGLGSLSDDEADHLAGTGDPAFVRRKLESLQDARTWVWSVVISMGLLALILPTAIIFQVFVTMGSLKKSLMFALLVGGSAFSATQMSIAIIVYRNWKRRLLCYRALNALHAQEA